MVQALPSGVVAGTLLGTSVVLEPTDAARDLYSKSRFGTMLAKGKVKLSLYEAAYLCEKEKIAVRSGTKTLSDEQLIAVGRKSEKAFPAKYAVFRDLRTRGYIVKTALKFGADFRVYDRGVKPGDDHAKWVVYAVQENEALTWQEWSAKNRVAHSTKKRLLIGVVDEEEDVSYWEARWMKP